MATSSLPPDKKRRLLQRVSSVETDPGDAWVAEHAPPGIRTAKDLHEWPLDVMESLTRPDRDEEIELRLHSHLLQGVSLCTDYSGLDCPREALEMGFRALQMLKGYDPDTAVSPVWVGRTCDKGQLQKRLQVALSSTLEAGQRCHFEDILHRLPLEGRQWIAAASPRRQASKSERGEAYKCIADWVMANRNMLFSVNAESQCVVHHRRLQETFGDTAVVLAWEDGPEWHGWPHRRRRILSLAVNRKTADWFGPTSSMEARADYSNRFYRQMVSTGEILMQGDQEERVKDMVALARARKNNADDTAVEKLFVDQDYDKLAQLLLPPGGVLRLKEWQELHKMKMAEAPLRAFLCDVDHTVKGKGPVGGELWPTQLTHGSVFALKGSEGESVGWRMATAKEHMTALGWRAHGSSEVFPVSKMLGVMSDLNLSPNQVKTLAGNSMHLRTQMSFMFYALGHIMLKSESPNVLQRATTWQWEADKMADDFESELDLMPQDDDEEAVDADDGSSRVRGRDPSFASTWQSQRSRGRGRGRQGSATAKAKNKANKVCFVPGCECRCKPHSKFCASHHKDAEAVRYQAKQQGDEEIKKTVEEALADPYKCKLALEDFARNNPAGRFRKKLIDWSAFQQTFGRRAEVRNRENEEEMDVSDYIAYMTRKGKTEEEAMDKWKELLADPNIERSGEGQDIKVWVPMNRTRMRDTIHYKDCSLAEGSKAAKDLKEADRQDLMDHVQRQQYNVADAWLRQGVGNFELQLQGGSKKALQEVKQEPSSSAGPEIALVRPKAVEKYEKLVSSCWRMTETAKKAVTEALQLAVDNTEDDKLQTAYEVNCVTRLYMLQVCEASTMADVPGLRTPPSCPTGGVKELTALASSSSKSATSAPAATMNQEQQANSLQQPSAPPPADAAKDGDQASQAAAATAAIQESPKKTVDAQSTSGDSNALSHNAKVTRFLKKALQMAGTSGQHVSDVDKIMGLSQMGDACQSLMDCSTIEELNKVVEALKAAAVGVKELKDGACKAASSLKSHIQARQRAGQKKRAADIKLQEHNEVQEKRKQAKLAAEQIKKQETVLPPILNLDWTAIANGADDRCVKVQLMDGPAKKSIKSMDLPVCVANFTPINDFLKNPKVQLLLGGFGGTYKKQLKQVSKVQDLVSKNHGLEEVDKLWSSIVELFEAKFTSPNEQMENYLQKIIQASWMVGFDTAAHYFGFLPNGLASMRLLCSGEMLWLLFDMRQLSAAMKVILEKDDHGGIEGVTEFVKNLDEKGVAMLAKHGCTVHMIQQGPGQVLFIPTGWFAVERCVKGLLVYGIRKTFIYPSQKASSNYEILQGVHVESKKPVDKMRATAAFIAPPDDD
ncbi:unnamed protein product [Symbiodinium sp. CCMP2456]|nr:unnamed protein product [Symbiodinium sp. CCMP2456]